MFLCVKLTTLSCCKLFTQKESILDAGRGSDYACFQISSGNVLCHHSKHLMEYFEFLHGSTIICLPLNISKILHWQYAFGKLEEAETHRLHLYWYDTIAMRPEGQHLLLKQTGITTFFHSDTNPVLGHVLVHSVDKTHVLVVTVELVRLFLNIWLFLFFLSTLFQHGTNLLGSHDSEEAA